MTCDDAQSKFKDFGSEEISDLKRVNERLRRRDEQARQLLYRVSHDVRAPLRHVRGYATMLSTKHGSELSEEAASLLSRIMARVEVADALFEAVLQLSRAQRLEVGSEPTALNDLVQEACRTLEGRSAEIEVAAGLPHLKVDAHWVSRALKEALTNACKFARTAPRIEVRAYEPLEGEPRGRGLIVVDHGIGVDERFRDRAFDLFERDASDDLPGLGAGLAIVREVAHGHGGDAWFRPRTNGTTELILLLAPDGAHDIDTGETS